MLLSCSSAFPKGCPLPPCQRRNNVTSAFHWREGRGRKWRIQPSFQGHGLEVVLTLHWPHGHISLQRRLGNVVFILVTCPVTVQGRRGEWILEIKQWSLPHSEVELGSKPKFDFQTKTLHYSSYCCLRRIEWGQELVVSFWSSPLPSQQFETFF